MTDVAIFDNTQILKYLKLEEEIMVRQLDAPVNRHFPVKKTSQLSV